MGKTAHSYVQSRQSKTRKFQPQKSQAQELLDRLPETSGLTGSRANFADRGKDFALYIEMIGDGMVPITAQTEVSLLLAGGAVLSMGPPPDGFLGVKLDSSSRGFVEWAPAWAVAVVRLSLVSAEKTSAAVDSFLGPDGKRHQLGESVVMPHVTVESRRGFVQKKMPGLLRDPREQLIVCGQAMLVLRPLGDFREALLACMAKLRRLEVLRKTEADRA